MAQETLENRKHRNIVRDRLFTSCTEEAETPITGKIISGEVPTWLTGAVYRNGPGLFEIGGYKYNHFFDGMAMFHKFDIRNGSVTYKSKFLNSDTYKTNKQANRIAVSEFGTTSYPDPCKNIFSRYFSWFTTHDSTDNCNVNFLNYGDGIYACSEGAQIHRVDPNTLQSVAKEKLSNYISVYTSTAHGHRDADGNFYNIGQSGNSKGILYTLVKYPNKKGKETFENATIVAQIQSRWGFSFAYYHSFGFTERYIVFIEQPLLISMYELNKAKYLKRSFQNCMSYHEDKLTRFYVIDKATGKISDRVFVTNPLFFFHSINMYEEDNHLVIDLAAFKDPRIITSLTENDSKEGTMKDYARADITRFVLPLQPELSKVDENLIKLDYTTAKATLQDNGEVFCEPQTMDLKDYTIELPQINLENYNGRKYKYVYGVSTTNKRQEKNPLHVPEILKFDFLTQELKTWGHPDFYPSEPIFVERPNATTEDDGVLLVPLIKIKQHNIVFLLILDAKSLKETALVQFDTPSAVPSGLHGIFRR